jgi:hypothetical protein
MRSHSGGLAKENSTTPTHRRHPVYEDTQCTVGTSPPRSNLQQPVVISWNGIPWHPVNLYMAIRVAKFGAKEMPITLGFDLQLLNAGSSGRCLPTSAVVLTCLATSGPQALLPAFGRASIWSAFSLPLLAHLSCMRLHFRVFSCCIALSPFSAYSLPFTSIVRIDFHGIDFLPQQSL